MTATIASTTPYAWPYDGAFAPVRTALLVVGSDGAPAPEPAVAAMAGPLLAAGGVVVQVTTAPPRRETVAVPTLPQVSHHVTSYGVDGFYGSPLDSLLRSLGRDQLLLTGAWLETSVHSTLRSANDRGLECLLVLDACTAYDASLLAASSSQIEMSGGIFGAVGDSAAVIDAIPVPERNLA